MDKLRVVPGQTVEVKLPWSEVVMHLGLADHVRPVRITADGNGAQILTPEGAPVSYPVLPGEAGFYRDADGLYTYTL